MAEKTLQNELVLAPSQHLLSGKIAEEWCLVRPILLNVEVGEEGEYIVSYDPFETYGAGDTVEEAIADFSSMLIDLYNELSESEETLSAYLQDLLDRLRLTLSPL